MNFYLFVNVVLLIVLADNISSQEAAAAKPDCRLVLCAMPNCPSGQQAVKQPNKCCYECRPTKPIDCSTVLCAYTTCPNGEQPVVPPNQCCPVCPSSPDCSTVLCAYPECANGQQPVTPPNQCCSVCPA